MSEFKSDHIHFMTKTRIRSLSKSLFFSDLRLNRTNLSTFSPPNSVITPDQIIQLQLIEMKSYHSPQALLWLDVVKRIFDDPEGAIVTFSGEVLEVTVSLLGFLLRWGKGNGGGERFVVVSQPLVSILVSIILDKGAGDEPPE